MAGPNSAPNGDRGLIRGDKHERFVAVPRKKVLDTGETVEYTEYVPQREYDAKRGRLFTGKTLQKRKRSE
jgi:hypothetical protein